MIKIRRLFKFSVNSKDQARVKCIDKRYITFLGVPIYKSTYVESSFEVGNNKKTGFK